MKHTPKSVLMWLSKKNKGDWLGIFRDIQNKTEIPYDADVSNDYDCVTILDPQYSNKLRQSWHPPFVLWYLGDLNLLNEPNIMCVCGQHSPNKDAIDLIKHICDSHVIINGDDSALERVALQTAMAEGKKFIMVLNQSLYNIDYDDTLIQYAIHNGCLLISEYGWEDPDDIEKSEKEKQRIVGFLADKMLVTSSSRSNTRLKLLIDECLGKGSDLFALPAPPFKGELTNDLIRDGAILVNQKSDIF